MRSITNNSVERIEILNGQGERTGVIEIDAADTGLPDRFLKMIKNLDSLSQEFSGESQEFSKKYGELNDREDRENELDIDMLTAFSRMRINSLNKCVAEIDRVFGEGIVQQFCADNCRLNPDYIPDEAQLFDLVNQLVPIVNELFGQRFERVRKDYSPGKRGTAKKRRDHD